MGEPVWLLRAMGLFFAFFFGLWGLVAGRHVFRFGPALVIDAEGVDDFVSLARLGRIPWSEIAGFRSARLTSIDLLVIRLRDPGRALRGAWPWMRLVHWARLRRYGSPVVVPMLVLRTSVTELLATCKSSHAEAKKRGRQRTPDLTSNR